MAWQHKESRLKSSKSKVREMRIILKEKREYRVLVCYFFIYKKNYLYGKHVVLHSVVLFISQGDLLVSNSVLNCQNSCLVKYFYYKYLDNFFFI